MDWEAELATHLRTYSKNLKAIKKRHKCSKTALIVNWLFFLKNFYTKKGSIHKRSGDYDNHIKLPNDVLAKELDVDDSAFIGGYNFKMPAKKNYMVLRIEIIDLEELNARNDFVKRSSKRNARLLRGTDN